MYAPNERKAMLNEMRNDVLKRLQDAQADLDAIDRLIAVQTDIEPPTTPSSVEEIRLGAIAILSEFGTMHRLELLEKLEERGIHVGGKVPVNNLGSVLSRFGDDFTSYGQGKWGKRPRPLGMAVGISPRARPAYGGGHMTEIKELDDRPITHSGLEE